MFPNRKWLTLAAILGAIGPGAGDVYLRGAGSSFAGVVYKDWLSFYELQRRQFVKIVTSYDAVGSGNGKLRIMGKSEPPVEFGASDVPLTPDEGASFPDLQLVPTMAGAVVVCHNLPGVSSLTLTRDNIVGIYNGTITHWNDSRITAVNAGQRLPEERIRVVARSDPSGTTELFTAALSSFSPAWRHRYGVFEEGVDANYTPLHWNPEVLAYYGKTTRGVLGLVMSIRYTIAYLSAADAEEYNISQACIVNREGVAVGPTVETVQNAMQQLGTSHNGLTADIIDKPGSHSYPIAGFTYLIIKMNTLASCASAVELYRYVNWYMNDLGAVQHCESLNMVPLSAAVVRQVEGIMNQMTCGGELVHQLALNQMNRERIALQTWRKPVYITIPITVFLLVASVVYLIYRYIKVNMALLKEMYKISPDRVVLMGKKPTRMSHVSVRSTTTTYSDQLALQMNSFKIATLDGEELVILKNIDLSDTPLKRSSKNLLLWMQTCIKHSNIQSLLGISYLDTLLHTVTPYCSKGTLEDVLHANKYALDDNFRYSMSIDITSGMSYLHSRDLVHGHLCSAVCYIDSKWNVHIAEWEKYSLCMTQFGGVVNNAVRPTNDSEQGNANTLLWRAPELTQGVQSHPTKASDVFTFGVLLHEIFTLRMPYPELDNMDAEQLLAVMGTRTIRPRAGKEVSQKLATLLYEMWAGSSESRPNFPAILKRITKINPSKKSVLDCMMDAVDDYVTRLEDKIQERTAELQITMTRVQNLLYQMLPPSVAEQLAQGQQVKPEAHESVTVYFSDIKGFTSLSAESTPLQIVNLLNSLYTLFDDILDKHDVYKVETIGDAYMVISGLFTANGIQHAGHVSNMALDLACAVSHFHIPHRDNQRLHLRIGIHSGAVMAGVVGNKMPRYCLFGDTVNTASRMESTSLAMKIQISEVSQQLLTQIGGYHTVRRGTLAVKGKGTMTTYWLHGRSGHEPLPPEFLRDVVTDKLSLTE